jgi:hypothetical protein
VNRSNPVTHTVIRIGAINHLEGGIDTRPDGGRSLDRLDAQLDLLAELDLDVILSTEGKGWLEDDNHVLGYAAHRLGMNPFLAPAPRHDCNVVIWLRPGRFRDVREHHELHPPFWHAQARVSAALDGVGERIWFFAAHYSPFVPEIQVQEAKATADLADERLVLGGGDFQDDAFGDPVPDRCPRTSSCATCTRPGLAPPRCCTRPGSRTSPLRWDGANRPPGSPTVPRCAATGSTPPDALRRRRAPTPCWTRATS